MHKLCSCKMIVFFHVFQKFLCVNCTGHKAPLDHISTKPSGYFVSLDQIEGLVNFMDSLATANKLWAGKGGAFCLLSG